MRLAYERAPSAADPGVVSHEEIERHRRANVLACARAGALVASCPGIGTDEEIATATRVLMRAIEALEGTGG